LEDVRQIAVERDFIKGKPVFFEGDRGSGFYIVVDGLIKIFKLAPDGKEQIIKVTLGEMPEEVAAADPILEREHGAVVPPPAEALAAATVGIAMGVAGTDTAIETSDIALMSDDLLKLPFLIRVARKTLTIIKTNIYFSILVKAAFIMAVFLGVANLWMAVAADTGTSLLVTLNGMRLAAINSPPKGESA